MLNEGERAQAREGVLTAKTYRERGEDGKLAPRRRKSERGGESSEMDGRQKQDLITGWRARKVRAQGGVEGGERGRG